MAVFATMMLVQTVVLIFTVPTYEAEQLGNLRELARTALMFSLGDSREQQNAPLAREAAAKLLSDSQIVGLTIYKLDDKVVQVYGSPTLLRPVLGREMLSTYRSPDNKSYETIFVSGELGHPFNIVARLDSSNVQPHIIGYIRICGSSFSCLDSSPAC